MRHFKFKLSIYLSLDNSGAVHQREGPIDAEFGLLTFQIINMHKNLYNMLRDMLVFRQKISNTLIIGQDLHIHNCALALFSCSFIG